MDGLRRDVWAAAVDRSARPAMPAESARAAVPAEPAGPALPASRRPGDVAAELVGGVAGEVAAQLRAVLFGRDPARVHARRIRRARRRVGVGSVAAVGFGALAATVGTQPGPEGGEVVLGGLAAAGTLIAVNAALRVSELRRRPVPPPVPGRSRAGRPPRDCPSRGLLDRLAERERALAGLLVHLGPAAAEPRLVAADAGARLRDLGARITAVDRARRGAPTSGLDAAVTELCGRLDTGVTAYSALVVAAADAVAAGASGDRLVALRLAEATDSLAGLAAGLREVAG